ncbi:MAG: hypothetical protein AB1454_11110 [Candidatus Auribacterota bacterium]|jgi:type II secretory pathway component PulK|uniref:General secretion pathway protein GspK n=1 Tax=Candidatus Auribacter fodinae TaxID=2093366 RepID=A0A3A4R9B7_9BACT|nr:MAG: hypothetical protein C4541_08720 [Candidatus Auribacter fodinae]
MKLCSKEINSGSIIILALWVLALLSLFAVGLGYRGTIELRLTGLYINKMKASYALQQGLYTVFFHIANDSDRKVDAYNESWGNNTDAFFESEIDEGVKLTVAHTAESNDNELITLYGAEDEESRININVLPTSILSSEYWEEEFGIDDDLIEVIDHWRQKNSGNKELDAWYESTYGYEARHGNIQLLEELHFLKNFFSNSSDKNKSRARLKNIITFWGKGAVNFNTASREVLSALFAMQSDQKEMSKSERDDLIRLIIEYRNGDDGLPGTEDDQIFKDQNIETAIGTHEASKMTMLNWLRTKKLVGVTSDFFRIEAEVTFDDKKLQRKVTAIVSRSKDYARENKTTTERNKTLSVIDEKKDEEYDPMRIIKYFEE